MYTVESINGCTKKIQFNFETINLENEIKQALLEKRKSVELKGFRKGKAPLKLVEGIYEKQLKDKAIEDFISKEFFNVLNKENLMPISTPTLTNKKVELDKNKISFEAIFEIYPEFKLPEMTGYEFVQKKQEVTDEDIQKAEKELKEAGAEKVKVTDPAVELANGHIAVINFQGELEDGQKPEELSAQNFKIEIGSQQFIPGMEDQMQGMKLGEKKEVQVIFPSDFHQENLRDKNVKFLIELVEFSEKKYSEFNDEYFKKFGFASQQDYRDKVSENLLKSRTEESNRDLNKSIVDKLVEETTFDLPESVVSGQKKALEEDLMQEFLRKGGKKQQFNEYLEKWDSDISQKAVYQVKSFLILDQLAKDNNIEVGHQEIESEANLMAKRYNLSVEELSKRFYQGKIQAHLGNMLKERKIFDLLKSKVKVNLQ